MNKVKKYFHSFVFIDDNDNNDDNDDDEQEKGKI